MERTGLAWLLPVTIRRAFIAGKFYVAIATAVSLILALVLVRNPHHLFASTFPLEAPLFATLGSLGGLMIFAGDRTKGVFEYLIAYGVKPVTLFVNGLLASIAVSTVVLGGILLVGLGIFYGSGGATTLDLEKTLGLYTVPMTYAGTTFLTTAGMYWSSLASPRMGVNSPVGIAPLLGIAPTILILIIAESSPTSQYYYITAGGAGAVAGLSLILLALSGKLMSRERFLSPI
ncbi:MAG: hypothetical protein ACREEC_14830 [Thermoplasmata archaeon]